MSDLASEDDRRRRRRASWFGAGALLIDSLTLAVAVAVVVPHLMLATDLRTSFPALDGKCLTWSYRAPLALAVISLASIPLAYRAEYWEIPHRTRRLVGLARVVSLAAPLAWALTAVAVAYIDSTICTY